MKRHPGWCPSDGTSTVCLVCLVSLSAIGSTSVAATADVDAVSADASIVETAEAPSSPLDQPRPRFTLSFERFSVDGPDGRAVPLSGARFVAYPLSEKWFRLGIGAEGGGGHTNVEGGDISLAYGVLGLTVGLQYPAGRLTPFLEGHLTGGALTGHLDGAIDISGTTVENASATTWLVGRGLEAGVDIYAFGRSYVSLSLGWTRSTWEGPDLRSPQGTDLRLTNLTSDSLIWTVGVGL